MSKLIMLIGCAGAGKSTVAQQLEATEDNCVIFSSDQLRYELYKDSTDQTHNTIIFQELHKRIHQHLLYDGTAIYDATNLSRKYRCAFLQSLPKNIEKECVVVLATERTCIERQKTRNRQVPTDVIHRQCQSFQVPTYREGWDSIIVKRTDTGYSSQNLLDLSFKIKQDNPHHLDTIGHHNVAVAEIVGKQNPIIYSAALWHDIGKCFTKRFDENHIAHYYGHATYGSYIVLLNQDLITTYSQLDLLDIAFYIEHHMDLFDIRTEKQYHAWAKRNNLSTKDLSALKIIHSADIICSNQDSEWSAGKGLFYGNMDN